MRLHGYSIENDLAPNYTFAETVLLALTGQLPSPEKGRAFEIALTFLAQTSAAEGPIHATLLARICVASTSALTGTGAIALGEQARFELSSYVPFLEWLSYNESGPPSAFITDDPSSRKQTVALRDALHARKALVPRTLLTCLQPRAATIAVLYACGVTSLEQIEAVQTFARYPLLMAEVLAAPPAKYKDYPVNLPAMRYEENVQ
ncbi:MAG: hypothetical protein ACRELY_26225 [Polyangiaceae bacterium]